MVISTAVFEKWRIKYMGAIMKALARQDMIPIVHNFNGIENLFETHSD